jgi:hypothetical protein
LGSEKQLDAARRRAEIAASRRHEDEVVRSGHGIGDTFASVLSRRLSRRDVVKGTAAGAAAMVLTVPAVKSLDGGTASAQSETQGIKFSPLAPQPLTNQFVMTADGYVSGVLLAWGDPVVPGAPEFDPENMTPEAQSMQFGYNSDYIGLMPLPWDSQSSDSVLLWNNHEYTNEEIMFAGWDPANPTEDQVNIGMEAHGGSVVELARDSRGSYTVARNSMYNRRITAFTPMAVSGAAADHPWLKTSGDPDGRTILGTLNNCAGGITPWGTILTCEENFHQYFAWLSWLSPDDPRYAVHERYGMPEEASERGWETVHGRFMISGEPNEGFRFGWVVEIDPYNPESIPVKRTALGRFRHEGAQFGYSPSGRVAFYSGDDARFEYVYKYVSNNAWDPNVRGIDQGLLDDGVLYVAKFNDDGTGEWLPLVYGEGPLTEENGFVSQGDVLVKTRLAADALGATKMDRPEDIEQNPVTKKVYGAFTNNTQRTEEDVDPANPRPDNTYGHIIEWTETDNDAASTTFTWEMFILCGNPEDEDTYFAGFPKDSVSPVSCPDNLNFDLAGNLWIATDGMPGTLELADSLLAVPTEGPERGDVQMFLSVVYGSECAAMEFSRDNRTLLVAVQHPGEGGTVEEPITLWPFTSSVPRPGIIQVFASDGGPVGQS